VQIKTDCTPKPTKWIRWFGVFRTVPIGYRPDVL